MKFAHPSVSTFAIKTKPFPTAPFLSIGYIIYPPPVPAVTVPHVLTHANEVPAFVLSDGIVVNVPNNSPEREIT